MNLSNDKNIAIYPYNSRFTPIVRTWVEDKTFNSITLVSPISFQLDGKDASYADKTKDIGINVTSNNEEIYNSDILLIADGDFTPEFSHRLTDVIMKAMDKNISIICTLKLSDEDKDNMQEYSEKTNTTFWYCQYMSENSKTFEKSLCDRNLLYRPRVPVIFVGGIYENLNQMDIALKTKRKFEKDGYTVSCLLDNAYADIIQCRSIPSYFRTTKFSEQEKIKLFNGYIEEIEKSENPDLFIIVLPGGLIRYNSRIFNDFGVYAYLISQAVQADNFICCVPYGVNEEFCNDISIKFQYLLRSHVNHFHIANKFLDIALTKERGKNMLINIEYREVDNYIIHNVNDKLKIISAFDDDNFEKIYRNILDFLTSCTINV